MADKFIIEGGGKLEGEITVNGSKNAAGAILAATLLTEEKCVIDNVPKVTDILNLVDILEEMGASIELKLAMMLRLNELILISFLNRGFRFY
jgi:UDP-N-acetylglucosamine 1-carboxyvinyltransferase